MSKQANPKCPECGKTDQVKSWRENAIAGGAIEVDAEADEHLRFVCQRCGIWFTRSGEYGDLE
jgi:hypothetical protein